jgi:hypothetical protein
MKSVNFRVFVHMEDLLQVLNFMAMKGSAHPACLPGCFGLALRGG